MKMKKVKNDFYHQDKNFEIGTNLEFVGISKGWKFEKKIKKEKNKV